MSFPMSPTEGTIFNKYIYKSNRWQLRVDSSSPNSGDIDLGKLYLLAPTNKNNTSICIASPVAGTIYTQSVSSRVPSTAKGVLLRWWVQKSTTTEANSWYWAGFAAGDDSVTLSSFTAASICTGSEFSGNGTYHHDVVSVPLDSSGNFKILFHNVGAMSSFSYNVLGYYL